MYLLKIQIYRALRLNVKIYNWPICKCALYMFGMSIMCVWLKLCAYMFYVLFLVWIDWRNDQNIYNLKPYNRLGVLFIRPRTVTWTSFEHRDISKYWVIKQNMNWGYLKIGTKYSKLQVIKCIRHVFFKVGIACMV